MPVTLPAAGDAALEAKALAWRRRLVAWLNLISLGIMAGWCAAVLNVGGWSAVDLGIFIAFLFVLPWTMLGFWNALIGLILLHGARHPPPPRAPDPATAAAPLQLRTAIFMTLRNEAPERALLRLRLIKADLDASGQGEHFGYFLLSDSDNDEIAAAELAGFSAWKAQAGRDVALFYRRRSDNHGFKAGNIADFLARWGDEYDLMLPLDADSLMDAATILNGVQALQAQPKLGILQTLVVGMPSASAFARIFQFGMRQGMRVYTNGQVWWTGDCGQFWGHNAFVRIAPFRAACALPEIPGGPPFGGPIR